MNYTLEQFFAFTVLGLCIMAATESVSQAELRSGDRFGERLYAKAIGDLVNLDA